MTESQKFAMLFATLSDANRLQIICYIGRASRPVSEIVTSLGLSQPLVSHHLRVLREQKILKTRREGPFIYYELSDLRMLDALGVLSEIALNVGCDCSNEKRMFCCPDWFKKTVKKC